MRLDNDGRMVTLEELDAAAASSTVVDESERFLRSSPVYRALVDEVQARAHNRCELRVVKVCQGWGEHPHHVYPTREGGPVLCPARWLLWACQGCHGFVHAAATRPEAEAGGLIVPYNRHEGATPDEPAA